MATCRKTTNHYRDVVYVSVLVALMCLDACSAYRSSRRSRHSRQRDNRQHRAGGMELKLIGGRWVVNSLLSFCCFFNYLLYHNHKHCAWHVIIISYNLSTIELESFDSKKIRISQSLHLYDCNDIINFVILGIAKEVITPPVKTPRGGTLKN